VNVKDANAIIEILKEKYVEGIARKDENMKQEVERLIEEVQKQVDKNH
jgi:hypothetical protein